MPIDPEFRFWSPSGAFQPGVSEWFISDVDQRRIIVVKMDLDYVEEAVATEHLRRHIDSLAPDVVWIHVAPNGDLISASTDPEHDQTHCTYYPPLESFQLPDRVQTILRSDLRELDRFIGNVDLVSYQTDSDPPVTRKAVFKSYWQRQFIEKQWDESNLWMRLSHHPNIVPFDRLVLDEVRGGVVGFTTVYIPGGTLEDNISRTFKLKWCKQLMQLVDDLNLRYGIAHQDIVPRNLVVDEASDNIMLFDFNVSAQIGRNRGKSFFSYSNIRDDVRAVIFTIYEVITRDFHFREDDWAKLDVSMVQDIEWIQHPDVTLDHPVAEYRALLNAWVRSREEGPRVTVYSEAPEYIDWPVLERQMLERVTADGRHVKFPGWDDIPRRSARKMGLKVAEWQRPPQSALKGDYHLLATGKLLDSA